MDLALAAFGSNEESTTEADYEDGAGYAKNAKEYLQKIDFRPENIVVNTDRDNEDAFDKFPTKDSVGYVIGMKEIEVWDPVNHVNQPYKLTAIGVRGGGYGAEWASNMTLGNGADKAADPNGNGVAHKGFRDSADKVMNLLDTFVDQHTTSTDKVKYWVCGYSRAGAIANLVAGDITDALDRYHTSKQDIYGYTFEGAAGAVATDDLNGQAYPNIHNIVNSMDLVPRISCAEFNNARLGVDYYVPDYSNAGAEETFVPVNEDGLVLNAALNSAILNMLDASGEKSASVTANYVKDESQTYRVNIRYLTGETELWAYTTKSYVVGDAVMLTADSEYMSGGSTYYFDHWDVDGKRYDTPAITLRPNKSGDYTATAIYSATIPESAGTAKAVILNHYAETQNGKNKIAVTMTWEVPDGCSFIQAGFRVSRDYPLLDDGFAITKTSQNGATGTYTLHINMTGKEADEVYICAYLIYLDANGKEHTALSDILTTSWDELHALQ